MILQIHGVLQGIGYGLLVLFFAMGVFQSTASFRDFQRPEFALRHFIRFAAAKVAVSYGMELMNAIFDICGGVVQTVMGSVGEAVETTATLPGELVEAIESIGFLESIPLWLVTILGSLLITVLSFILILTVYGRFFRLFLYTALSPLSLASFAGEGTSSMGKALYQVLCGRVHGGRGDRPGLPGVFGVPLQQQHRSQHRAFRRDHGLAVCGPVGVQYAGTHRAGQRRPTAS